jgi:pseudaminic acid cytidylyltransferase
MKPICIIPARGGSKRFPRKNVALLAGKPLITHVITTALDSGIFEKVILSSDDTEILSVGKDAGAEALERPQELGEDTARVKDVCRHIITNEFPVDSFGVILPTSPFCTSEDVNSAYKIFVDNEANYVMSVVSYDHPPQCAVSAKENVIRPFFGDDYFTKRSQELDDLYYHDGSIFFAKSTVFLSEDTQYGSRVFPYFIPRERSTNIDTPLDLAWAEFLLTKDMAGVC